MKLTPMEVARGNLLIDSPFFGSIAVRLQPKEDDKQPTAYTNGKILGFNPEWFEALNPRQRNGLLAHEILHVANLHHTRRGQRDPELWNIACDYAINLELRDCGLELPEGGLLDDKWAGMGAEAIYAALEQAGAGGRPEPQPWGQVQDAVGEDGQPVPANEMDQAEGEAKVMIGQAIQQAKAMGQMPDGLERALRELMKPKVDWRSVLHQFIQKASAEKIDWSRPNRRMVGQGFYLPRIKGEFLEIAVAIDTSGSIGEDDLKQFLGEVEGILSMCSSKAWVIYCDSEVNRVDEVTSEELPLEVVPCGGGGTDFRPVFEWMEKCEGNPACLVYITDMCGQFPEEAPDFPVLWVKTMDIDAPFGEEVKLS